MESDFVTQQHVESLGNGDPNFAEVLNRYKFAPNFPAAKPQFAGFSGVGMGTNNEAVLLSNMLGQIQAGLQKGTQSSNLDGFQLNINSDVLKWVVLLLLVIVLVWLFLSFNGKKRRNPLKKRLDKIETQLKEMRSFKNKNPKALPVDEDDDLDLD